MKNGLLALACVTLLLTGCKKNEEMQYYRGSVVKIGDESFAHMGDRSALWVKQGDSHVAAVPFTGGENRIDFYLVLGSLTGYQTRGLIEGGEEARISNGIYKPIPPDQRREVEGHLRKLHGIESRIIFVDSPKYKPAD